VLAADIDDLLVGTGYWTRAQVDDAVAEYGVQTAGTPTPEPSESP
jgi:hypothetical protein